MQSGPGMLTVARRVRGLSCWIRLFGLLGTLEPTISLLTRSEMHMQPNLIAKLSGEGCHRSGKALYSRTVEGCFRSTHASLGRPQKRCCRAVGCISLKISYLTVSCWMASIALPPCGLFSLRSVFRSARISLGRPQKHCSRADNAFP